MIIEPKRRIAFVDIMKAITIFLVVLGHTTICSPGIIRWIYSFHMPAFFAIYGLTFDADVHSEKHWMTKSFLIKKIKRLLIPCFIWGLIYADFSIRNIAYVFYGSQTSFIRASSLSSLWFLTCMFLTVCLFELLMCAVSNLKNHAVKVTILTATAVISFLAGCFLPRLKIGYPWCIDVMLPALTFVILGFGIRLSIQSVDRLNAGHTLLWSTILVVSIVVTFVFIPNLSFVKGNNVDLASRSFGSPILYAVAALAGIIMLTALSVLLSKVRFMKWSAIIGRYSLPILLLHKFPIVYLSGILSSKGLDRTVYAIILSVLVTAVCFFVAKALELFAPGLIGLDKKDQPQHSCD